LEDNAEARYVLDEYESDDGMAPRKPNAGALTGEGLSASSMELMQKSVLPMANIFARNS
jgi:hypothetical protein